MNLVKSFFTNLWNDEEGLGTLEMLLIVAVLVAVALLFGRKIIEWVEKIISDINPTPPGTNM
ncbi:Flp1 family type IVb pilin [Bacillus alkalicellulosilyticus]|uniref:Flp1 family type IVb pilin n=1 Tax=Alkalihalobacterium alkalicellulosilyticum TaxID=1912214 RepID=UPI0014829EB8|nr:Flp1 family type IVb pilin [Bacillus alkalicellulosilyticus]